MPHDILGRELTQLDLVAAPIGRSLGLGIISDVLLTGGIQVHTFLPQRNPPIKSKIYLFPANELIRLNKLELNENNSQHVILLNLIHQLREGK